MNRRVVTPSTPLNGRPVPISTHSYTHTHTHTHTEVGLPHFG